MERRRKGFTYTQTIAFSFVAIIFIGAVILSLPISSRSGEWTNFVDSLFTATSATCVTGLVVYDTCLHWSLFGQTIILLLIQIGGLSFMTVITMFSIFVGKTIGLHERRLLMQSAGTIRYTGIIKLIKQIVMLTVLFEGVGALLLFVRFYPELGLAKGLYYAVFHSVSAFCNAGFDLMGYRGEFSSLISFADDVFVNLTIMFLIFAGGLGFLVWTNLIKKRFRFKELDLHAKIVVTVTVILIVSGALLIYIFEADNAFAHLNGPGKVMGAFFQSIATRTAGFGTVDQAALSPSGSLVSMMLMFIGGSPGSTAGGIKTTTFAVLFINAVTYARNENGINIFKRKISSDTAKQAAAIFGVHFIFMLAATIIICAVEHVELMECLYETVSAISTVGYSMGLTPGFSDVSLIVLCVLMYAGRIGGLSFMLTFAEKRKRVQIERPEEKILIG